MENRFTKCCFGFEPSGTRSECDRLTCSGNHNPAFNLYYQRANNNYCYCLNRKQLGQYWRCVVQDRDSLCPSKCKHCSICKEMNDVFVELQDAYFFQPNTRPIEDKTYQPVMWCVFNSTIDRNTKNFRVEIAKSIPHVRFVLDYNEQACSSKIYCLFNT